MGFRFNATICLHVRQRRDDAVRNGQKLGDVKISAFHQRSNWSCIFDTK